MLTLQLILGLAVAVQTVPEAADRDSAAEAAAAEQARLIAQQCKARRFEVVVDLPVKGTIRPSRIRMCGKEGQTDAEWVRTLRDGAAKLSASQTLPKSAKDQAIAAIEAEIAKYEPPAADPLIANYSITPPPSATPRLSAPPVPTGAAAVAGYSALPPLDSGSASRPAAIRPAAARARPPRITLSCIEFGDSGPGRACGLLKRDTVISIRADEPLAAGGVHFLRNGESRGEIGLPAMAAGQHRKVKLPSRLCTGVVRTQVQIEIRSTPAQSAYVGGPFTLRC